MGARNGGEGRKRKGEPSRRKGTKPVAVLAKLLNHAFGRLELGLEAKWCERKILLDWLELKFVVGVV